MTHTEIVQQKKNEALNKIRKIFNPQCRPAYSPYYEEDGSFAEQREYWVRSIIDELEKELTNLKSKPIPK